jgi:hypothetical protein
MQRESTGNWINSFKRQKTEYLKTLRRVIMFPIKSLEHLASYKGKVTDLINFGQTPLGRRIDVCFDGELAFDYYYEP